MYVKGGQTTTPGVSGVLRLPKVPYMLSAQIVSTFRLRKLLGMVTRRASLFCTDFWLSSHPFNILTSRSDTSDKNHGHLWPCNSTCPCDNPTVVKFRNLVGCAQQLRGSYFYRKALERKSRQKAFPRLGCTQQQNSGYVLEQIHWPLKDFHQL